MCAELFIQAKNSNALCVWMSIKNGAYTFMKNSYTTISSCSKCHCENHKRRV